MSLKSVRLLQRETYVFVSDVKRTGRDTVRFGRCNVIPVNALPLAYAMRGRLRQWNVLTCCIVLTGEKYHLQEEEEGHGIRKLNSLARK